ncbi:MAG: chemotaxis protein [Pelagibacterales bacterium]|nr:chemotaxis protein [Pelagibacterales bacterium]|tara:strand:+ start:8127 stop:8576 length:450 start_codon:yes stop_codon:yes gene_type:complete
MRILKILVILGLLCTTSKSYSVEFGTEEEAKAMLDRAVNLMKFNELFALEQMTEGAGGFKVKDLYPLCVNANGILVGHPVNVGFNLLEFVDSDGKNVGEEFLKVAQENKISKVTYKLARITTEDEKEFEKTALVTKVKKYICAVGFYSN